MTTLNDDCWSCIYQQLIHQQACRLAHTSRRLRCIAERRASHRPFPAFPSPATAAADGGIGEKEFDMMKYHAWNRSREIVVMTPLELIRASHSRVLQSSLTDLELIIPFGPRLRVSFKLGTIEEYVPPYTTSEIIAAVGRYQGVRAIRLIFSRQTYFWSDRANIRKQSGMNYEQMNACAVDALQGFPTSIVLIETMIERWCKKLISFELWSDLGFESPFGAAVMKCLTRLVDVPHIAIHLTTTGLSLWWPFIRQIQFPSNSVLSLVGTLDPPKWNAGAFTMPTPPPLLQTAFDLYGQDFAGMQHPPTHILFAPTDAKDISISSEFNRHLRSNSFHCLFRPFRFHLRTERSPDTIYPAFHQRLQHYLQSFSSTQPSDLQSLALHFDAPAAFKPTETVNFNSLWQCIHQQLRCLHITSDAVPIMTPINAEEDGPVAPNRSILSSILYPTTDTTQDDHLDALFIFPHLEEFTFQRAYDALPSQVVDANISQRLRDAFPSLRSMHLFGLVVPDPLATDSASVLLKSLEAQTQGQPMTSPMVIEPTPLFSGIFLQLHELGLSMPLESAPFQLQAFPALLQQLVLELPQLQSFVLKSPTSLTYALPDIFIPFLLSSVQLQRVTILLDVNVWINEEGIKKHRTSGFDKPFVQLHHLWSRLQASHIMPPYQTPSIEQPLADISSLILPLLVSPADQHLYRTHLQQYADSWTTSSTSATALNHQTISSLSNTTTFPAPSHPTTDFSIHPDFGGMMMSISTYDRIDPKRMKATGLINPPIVNWPSRSMAEATRQDYEWTIQSAIDVFMLKVGSRPIAQRFIQFGFKREL